MPALTHARVTDDLVDKWATVWRASKPGDARAILDEAVKRGELGECIAGLVRTTYA